MWMLIIGTVLLVNNAIKGTSGCCEDTVIIKRIDDLEETLLEAIGGGSKPPKSCDELKKSDPSATSGEYTLESGQKVFCEMGSLPGCGEGGYQRVASFERTAGVDCPPGFTNVQDGGRLACQRAGTGCTSVKFDPGRTYKEVCGMVAGYQVGSGDSFIRYSSAGNINNINSAYVDGVSITQGSPRRHLWSYAASQGNGLNIICPCTGRNNQVPNVPNFIKNNNYYCEGAAQHGVNNVLWDGKTCTSYENAGCCNRPNLPWFHRTDIAESSDFIELRLCGDESVGNERFPIFQYQFFVR